ncbi:MAG: hypothetical protein ABL907_05145 [Hyphomicrobium sp.]
MSLFNDPSLWSILSLGWTVMYVAVVWSVVFWALGQPDQQSELVKNLTGGNVARGKI